MCVGTSTEGVGRRTTMHSPVSANFESAGRRRCGQVLDVYDEGSLSFDSLRTSLLHLHMSHNVHSLGSAPALAPAPAHVTIYSIVVLSLISGWKRQAMVMRWEDFLSFTNNGKLCAVGGGLGPSEFERAMVGELAG
eukprot:2689402-Rhodomonas_salina.2